MNIFVRHISDHPSRKQVQHFFRAPLAESGIHVYYTEDVRNKHLAILTVLDTVLA